MRVREIRNLFEKIMYFDSLSLSHPELTNSPSILAAQSLRVMQLYQALSPSILSQANFAPAKLLIADFNADKLDGLSQNDYDILDPILQLISNSPMQSLKPAEEVWSCLHEHPSELVTTCVPISVHRSSFW